MREIATSIDIDASPERVWEILSDFDGVWTEAELEARALHEQLVEGCVELLGRSHAAVRSDLEALASELMVDLEFEEMADSAG